MIRRLTKARQDALIEGFQQPRRVLDGDGKAGGGKRARVFKRGGGLAQSVQGRLKVPANGFEGLARFAVEPSIGARLGRDGRAPPNEPQ